MKIVGESRYAGTWVGALTPLVASCGAENTGAGIMLQLAGIVGVVGVLAAGVLAAALHRRMGPRAESAPLRVLGVRTLGARQRVVAIEAGDRVLILAHGPQRVELLTELPRDTWRNSEARRQVDAESATEPNVERFHERLRR